MAYKTGFGAVVQKAAELEAAKGSGGTKYFQIKKENEKAVIRFISDNIVPISTYTLKNKDGKYIEVVDCEELENPRPNIIKQRVDVEAFTRKSKDSEERYVPKPKPIALGVAVMRKEISTVDPKTGRRVSTFEDVLEEVKNPDGTTEMKVVPYLVKMSWSNFWQNLTPIFDREGALTTLDLEITRKGKGFDTDYQPYPFTGGEMSGPGEAEAYYAELLGDQIPDLIKWIEYRGSEEYYKKVVYPFLPEYEAPASEEGSETDGDASDVAPEADQQVAESAPAARSEAPASSSSQTDNLAKLKAKLAAANNKK